MVICQHTPAVLPLPGKVKQLQQPECGATPGQHGEMRQPPLVRSGSGQTLRQREGPAAAMHAVHATQVVFTSQVAAQVFHLE